MPNAGSRTDYLTHVMDLMPTFLSVAGADYPAAYSGESIVPLQGKSLMPLLEGDPSAEDESRELGWSAYGMDAYRKDNWKVLRLPEPYGNGDWQLYDLAADPGELQDLAYTFPRRTTELAQAWKDYADLNGVIQPDSATAYAKPIVGSKY
jgi:arylsulfatase